MNLKKLLRPKLLLLGFLFFYAFFFALRSFNHHQKLSLMRKGIISQLNNEVKTNRRLKAQLLLYEDKNYLEYLGRKHLLLVKPGEVLYRFVFERGGVH